MKKTIWTLSTALLLGNIGLGAVTTYATDYEDAKTAKTEGTISILENNSTDPVIPDPENPEEEIDPEEPTNPHLGQLRINYVSNFDFGAIKNVSNEIVQKARLDQVWSNGTEEGRVPFVATEDRRGSDRLGWELRVSQSTPLKDASGHELQGATITLSNFKYANPTEKTPVVNQNAVVLDETTQPLATADASQGAGAWTLALGNPDNEGHTDGVVLRIPANTAKNDTVYSTSIVWELVADPTTEAVR